MRNVAEYQVAGARVPSVTEVLDVAGLVDYREVPRQALERAGKGDAAFTRVVGLVADVMQVDVEMAPLIDAVLGDRAQHVVVDADDVAASATAASQSDLSGRVSLIAAHASAQGAKDDLSHEPGVVGRCDAYVDVRPEFRELAARLARVRAPVTTVPVERTEGLREARGGSFAGSQVHSIRLPGYLISAEIMFGMPDQRLSIRHDSGNSALPYVEGALLAIRRVSTLVGVHRGLDTVLDL